MFQRLYKCANVSFKVRVIFLLLDFHFPKNIHLRAFSIIRNTKAKQEKKNNFDDFIFLQFWFVRVESQGWYENTSYKNLCE